MLNVQVTAYGRQTVPDKGVVSSCGPLQNFWGSNHITGTAEPKVVKFCTLHRHFTESCLRHADRRGNGHR